MSWRSEYFNSPLRTQRPQRFFLSCFLRVLCGLRGKKNHGFTLIEAMAAVALLSFIAAAVWIALERCMVLAADTAQRNRAFEIARENMEKIVGLTNVEEKTEFGISEQFPDIRWQTAIEAFYESHSGKMWVQAISNAEYTDAEGRTQSVEMTYWLTELTDEQAQALMQSKQQQADQLAGHIIETEELAAEYAGVNVETIREWVRNNMPTFEGMYLKPWLDLYSAKNGNPTEQEKLEFLKRHPELVQQKKEEPQPAELPPEGEESPFDSDTERSDGPASESRDETDLNSRPAGLPPMPSGSSTSSP